MALLEVEDLRVGYGFPVLMGISFDVEEGETAVLFGLNGAGKTTTVATIAGLLKPDSGSIRFDGEEIGGQPPTELVRQGIALVPEGRRVFPGLTVAEQPAPRRLGRSARAARRSSEQRALVFEYFPRLAERAEQAAGTLSGGEQQMLAIGRALMSKPRLLLIDEASLGLSARRWPRPCSRSSAQINDDGVTVVIVEQNVGVLPYADRALIMEKGTLVYQGVGDEIRGAEPARDLPRWIGVSMKLNWRQLGGQLGDRPGRPRVPPVVPRVERRRVVRPRAGPDPLPHLRRPRRAVCDRAGRGAARDQRAAPGAGRAASTPWPSCGRPWSGWPCRRARVRGPVPILLGRGPKVSSWPDRAATTVPPASCSRGVACSRRSRSRRPRTGAWRRAGPATPPTSRCPSASRTRPRRALVAAGPPGPTQLSRGRGRGRRVRSRASDRRTSSSGASVRRRG